MIYVLCFVVSCWSMLRFCLFVVRLRFILCFLCLMRFYSCHVFFVLVCRLFISCFFCFDFDALLFILRFLCFWCVFDSFYSFRCVWFVFASFYVFCFVFVVFLIPFKFCFCLAICWRSWWLFWRKRYVDKRCRWKKSTNSIQAKNKLGQKLQQIPTVVVAVWLESLDGSSQQWCFSSYCTFLSSLQTCTPAWQIL